MTRLAFDTSESRFTKGLDNQGWCTLHRGFGGIRSPNYIVGTCCHGPTEYRNFFTFDLRGLDGRVEAVQRLIVRTTAP